MERTTRGLDKKDSSLTFREISPPHGWKQDSNFHYLRLTLPGFEAKDVTIHMDKYGHLVVRGVRQVTEHKYISFEETFEVPNDSHLEEAEGQFEDDQIYCVTIPKGKEGERRGHTHTVNMPKEETVGQLVKKDSSVHKYGSNEKPEGSPRRIPKNPLKVIKNDKSKKGITFAFFAALLIALLAGCVVLIVKFHRR